MEAGQVMRWLETRPWWWPWFVRCESYRVAERPAGRLYVTAMPVPRQLPARQRAAIRARQVYQITDARPSRVASRRDQ
jgi:hypothetical protein